MLRCVVILVILVLAIAWISNKQEEKNFQEELKLAEPHQFHSPRDSGRGRGRSADSDTQRGRLPQKEGRYR